MSQLAAHICGVRFPADSVGQPPLKLPADCMTVVFTREHGGEYG